MTITATAGAVATTAFSTINHTLNSVDIGRYERHQLSFICICLVAVVVVYFACYYQYGYDCTEHRIIADLLNCYQHIQNIYFIYYIVPL